MLKEGESNEREAHQSMRFTVRLGIVHKNAVPSRRQSVLPSFLVRHFQSTLSDLHGAQVPPLSLIV